MTHRGAPVSGSTDSAVLVLGLGNPLRGDDGIGPRVVAELEGRGLPEGVKALDGGIGGLDLLQIIEGWDRVVIVDAVDIGGATAELTPGHFVRFTLDQARLSESVERLSFHHAGLTEVLALGQALDRPLPRIVVFGVQPQKIGWGPGLSPDVENGLPRLVDAVLAEVGAR